MFRLNSPVMQLMARLFDLILLNLVFLICCIPVVTIGASCTALHTVCLKYADGDEPPVLGTFFTAFRSSPMQVLLAAASLVLLAVGLYLFPIQARYQNTIRANCRNALLLAVRHFPRTVLLALTVLIPLGLLLYGSTELFLLLGVLMLLMGGSVIAGIQAKILLPMFRQHENEGRN